LLDIRQAAGHEMAKDQLAWGRRRRNLADNTGRCVQAAPHPRHILWHDHVHDEHGSPFRKVRKGGVAAVLIGGEH
jgi:hypothetical protein